MKRVLLDTNIYGEIIDKKDEELVKAALNSSRKELLVYGCETVRKELRATGKKKMLPVKATGIKKLRIAPLLLYDFITASRSIQIDKKIEETAFDYLKVYKEITGKSDEKLMNDFLIVASATLKGLDIVYSEDNKTMCSPNARKACAIVNALRDLKTPEFESYMKFIRDLKRWLP